MSSRLSCDLGIHGPRRIHAEVIKTLDHLSNPYLDDLASRLVDLYSQGGGVSISEPALYKD
jgi:hypothetical protein